MTGHHTVVPALGFLQPQKQYHEWGLYGYKGKPQFTEPQMSLLVGAANTWLLTAT